MLELFFALYGISILTTSSSMLRASPIVNEWLNRIESSVSTGMLQLAYYSPKEALLVLIKSFNYIGGCTLIFQLILMRYFGWESKIAIYSSLYVLYTSFSIYLWIIKRDEIIEKLTNDYKRDVLKAFKWIFIGGLVYFVGHTGFEISQNANYIPDETDIKEAVLVFAVVAVCIVLTLGLTSVMAYFLAFLPAFLAVGYVVWVVYVARFFAKLGKGRVKYFLAVYFVFGSLYMAYLSYGSLKVS